MQTEDKIDYFRSKLPKNPPETKEELLALIKLGREMVAYISDQWDEGIASLAEKRKLPLAA